jgi:benzoyl-CoA reductase/2-hydroxyglutaryl-CoA dehydratase subunit BcrC/BadD/HgdB
MSRASDTIGWLCSYTPEEIILAAGLESRRILGRTGATAAADACLHPNLCAYVRACLSQVLEHPADIGGVVGVDSCDAMRRLLDVWRHKLSPRFFHVLSLPHVWEAGAVEFFQAELGRLLCTLSEFAGKEITQDDLRRGIALMNETRALLRRLDVLRRTNSSLTGVEFYQILLNAMTRPKQEFNAGLRERLRELETQAAESENSIRIVLSGGALDDPWVVEAVENAGGRVVADDLCCGSRYFEGLASTEGEPLRAIAERYILRALCARMSDTDDRVERLLGLIEESGAQGLIYYSVKFCDPHMLDWAPISEALHVRGIPALRCETDYSQSERERMRTRIEAFLEMLR